MKKPYNHLQVGKLYNIFIPVGSRLVFDHIEYYNDDVFMILTKPKKIRKTFNMLPENFYNMKALVRDRIVNIEFKEDQTNNFIKMVET